MSIEQKNYMGIVITERVKNTKMTTLVGQTSPSPFIVRVSVFSAKFDTETRLAIKDKLLYSYLMSESQFGDTVSHSGVSDGILGTLEQAFNYNVKPTTVDPMREKLKSVINRHVGEDSQIEGVFSNILEVIESSIEKKKMLVSGRKRLEVLLRSLTSCVYYNKDFSYDEINEVSQNRINDINKSLDVAITMLSRGDNTETKLLDAPFDPAKKDTNSAVKVELNFSGSGGGELFNETDRASTRSVSLNLSTTKDELSKPLSRGDSYYKSHGNLFRLVFATNHLSTFLRCDGSEFHCTIKRQGNDACDHVCDEHTDIPSKNKTQENIRGHAESELDTFYSEVDAIYRELASGGFKKTNELNSLKERVETLINNYSSLSKLASENRKNDVIDYLEKKEAAFIESCNSKLSSLPIEKRLLVNNSLMPFIKHLRLK